MVCRFAEEYKGHKTFSDNVPGYAQGAYFPGDEPGFHCKFDGQLCAACENGNLDDCDFGKTEYYCPDCFCNGHKQVHYLFDLPDGMTCLNCGKTFTKKEWLEAVNESAEEINSAILHQMNKINELEDKILNLEKELKERQCKIAGYKYANEMMMKERKIA